MFKKKNPLLLDEEKEDSLEETRRIKASLGVPLKEVSVMNKCGGKNPGRAMIKEIRKKKKTEFQRNKEIKAADKKRAEENRPQMGAVTHKAGNNYSRGNFTDAHGEVVYNEQLMMGICNLINRGYSFKRAARELCWSADKAFLELSNNSWFREKIEAAEKLRKESFCDVFEVMSTGVTLNQACEYCNRDVGIIIREIHESEDLREMWYIARQARADLLASEILAELNNPDLKAKDLQRLRTKLEAIKFTAPREVPEKWADRKILDHRHKHTVDYPERLMEGVKIKQQLLAGVGKQLPSGVVDGVILENETPGELDEVRQGFIDNKEANPPVKVRGESLLVNAEYDTKLQGERLRWQKEFETQEPSFSETPSVEGDVAGQP